MTPARELVPARRHPSAMAGGPALLALPVLLALSAAGPAAAEQNPYYIGATASYQHESNLLRLADGAAAPDGFTRADSVYSTSLLAGFDQPFGRQHAYANASVRDNRYAANSLYNYTGYNLGAGLDWSTAERISGSLTGNASRTLYAFNAGYGAGLLTQRNLQDARGVNASVSVGLVTEYSLVFNVGQLISTNSLQTDGVQALDYRQENASLGLQWRPRGATVLGVTLSTLRGRYPKYLLLDDGYHADRFTQPGVEVSAMLQPSGASNLEAHLGYSKTRYDLNAPRNFSGTTGKLIWSWQPRAKLRLSSRLARDTGQNSYAFTVFTGIPGSEFANGSQNYSQLFNTLRLQADYDVTGKVSLTTAYQAIQRNIVNAFFIDTPNNPYTPQSGKDDSRVLSLGARWAPLRSVLVGCDYSHEARSASGAITSPLHDNTVSCYGQFQLQQ